MDEVKLSNYFSGLSYEPFEAGRVTGAVARVLGVDPATIIWLSDWTITKNNSTHTELTYYDYTQIDVVLREGFVIRGRRKRSVEYYYFYPDRPQEHGYRVCVKGTANRDTYITTFHRAHAADVRRAHRAANKRGVLILGPSMELAQHLERRASHA